MKKKIITLCIFVLLIILVLILMISTNTTLYKYQMSTNLESIANVDDIEGWDLHIDEIDEMYFIGTNENRDEELPIEYSDQNLIINAFNTIKKSDIDWYDSHEGYFYGTFPSIKVIKKNGEIITLTIDPFLYQLQHNNWGYYLKNFQLEYVDIIRMLKEKYNLKYMDYEEYIPISGNPIDILSASSDGKYFVCLSKQNINEILSYLNHKSKLEYIFKSFDDLLKPYTNEIELNDVVETKDLKIKVIEIKEGKVTAAAVHIK